MDTGQVLLFLVSMPGSLRGAQGRPGSGCCSEGLELHTEVGFLNCQFQETLRTPGSLILHPQDSPNICPSANESTILPNPMTDHHSVMKTMDTRDHLDECHRLTAERRQPDRRRAHTV